MVAHDVKNSKMGKSKLDTAIGEEEMLVLGSGYNAARNLLFACIMSIVGVKRSAQRFDRLFIIGYENVIGTNINIATYQSIFSIIFVYGEFSYILHPQFTYQLCKDITVIAESNMEEFFFEIRACIAQLS